ncbi:MAG: DNA polymerase III subunit alpha [Flavobacteriales bacterium]|nr:DNA polymerase III subunit alpha [Flavobacteriales bacterium]MCB9447748.1 DNA polymerase III subunit alpha [Flavobacteriales bacterium]
MLVNCHTYYSFKYGTLSPRQLLQALSERGHNIAALTDINSTSACVDYVRLAPEYGIQPVLGIDFRNGAQQQYIGLARNNNGYKALNEHFILHSHTQTPFPNHAPSIPDTFIIYPLQNTSPESLQKHEFAGVRLSQLRHLPFSTWKNHAHKLVLLQPVTFLDKRGYNTHRLLRAIDNNTLLSKLAKQEEAPPDETMPSLRELQIMLEHHSLIANNTCRILEQCTISFEFKTPKNKMHFTSSSTEDIALLRQQCKEGITYRYPHITPEIIARMEKELDVICQLQFCAYFLINWDLVRFARRHNYYHVGRGSGANSMVAFLIGITDVDPLELDLYFERFINPSRNSPPDFDIDFCSRDRQAITQYLFDRHGWKHTALLGAYNTFQYRSVIRELGKVFGLPAQEIDKLQTLDHPKQADDMGKLVLQYSHLIHDFPNHLSVHSSGILVSQEALHTFTATTIPPKGFPTTHFSMLEAEDLGYAKFDILGQRGLSKIQDAITIIEKQRNTRIDIHDIQRFKEDEQVRHLLRTGMAIGCFYIESPAMRMLLTKLQADDYLRLVAASSIIRPGVSKSGMMGEYVRRYRYPEYRVSAREQLPELYDLLHETYGVMVYQEDVMKVAHYFAELTMGEADILRRGMSWKFKQRNEFHKVRDRFFSNCKAKGYSEPVIADIWKQIESFANYAFAKGHSASYAVESFQALYLKAHFPLEYLTATINNGGGFYRPELYIHEAVMLGGKVEAPCINSSHMAATLHGNSIYLGLGMVKGLDEQVIRKLLATRDYEGPFGSLQDITNRMEIPLEQLRILIRIGALRFTKKPAKELLWDAHDLLGNRKRSAPTPSLFRETARKFTLPELFHHPLETAYTEMELLGFSLSTSPFELVTQLPEDKIPADKMKYHVGKIIEITGYLVHVKHTQTGNGQKMSFGTFIDRQGHWIDSVQFPNISQRYPFRGPGCYLIKGKVVDDFGFITLETIQLHRLEYNHMDEVPHRLKLPSSYDTGRVMPSSKKR